MLQTSNDPEERAHAPTAVHLADLFCQISRRRVKQRFDSLFNNDDVAIYKTAQRVMADEIRWLEKGDVMEPA